jgi:MFS family permease
MSVSDERAGKSRLDRSQLALLRQGPFRRYIIGSLISDSGTWMQMMAQSWVMSGLTSKAILLGLVNFAAGLPALILAPVAGSLADRLDKRKILVATQIAQIIFAVALGFLGNERSYPDLAHYFLCAAPGDCFCLRNAGYQCACAGVSETG